MAASILDLDILTGYYRVYFLRAPDAPGFNEWQTKLADGTASVQQISNGFYDNLYAQNIYGGMTDREYVEAIYANALSGTGGQVPSEAEINGWVAELQSGLSRADMVWQFLTAALTIDFTQPPPPGFTPEEWAAGKLRQDALKNSNDVARTFISELGPATAVSETDPLRYDDDPAFQAAQKIIRGVTYDPRTLDSAQSFIENQAAPSGNPIQTINDAEESEIFFTLTLDLYGAYLLGYDEQGDVELPSAEPLSDWNLNISIPLNNTAINSMLDGEVRLLLDALSVSFDFATDQTRDLVLTASSTIDTVNSLTVTNGVLDVSAMGAAGFNIGGDIILNSTVIMTAAQAQELVDSGNNIRSETPTASKIVIVDDEGNELSSIELPDDESTVVLRKVGDNDFGTKDPNAEEGDPTVTSNQTWNYSGSKGLARTLDLSDESIAEKVTLTVVLAEINAQGNKGDLTNGRGQGAKSDFTIELPDLEDIAGTLTIRNMTVGDAGGPVNDILVVSGVGNATNLAGEIAGITIRLGNVGEGVLGDISYLTFNIDLKDAGNLILVNAINQDTFDAWNIDDTNGITKSGNTYTVTETGVMTLVDLLNTWGNIDFAAVG